VASDAVLDQDGADLFFEEFVVWVGGCGILGEARLAQEEQGQGEDGGDWRGTVEHSRSDPGIGSKQVRYSIQRKRVWLPMESMKFRGLFGRFEGR
jgi:hypothetical protein